MKRTNVVVDEKLVARGRRLTEIASVRELIDRALKDLVKREEQRRRAVRLRGSGWTGDLDEMRRS